MHVFVVLVRDRHCDPVVRVFADRGRAEALAETEAVALSCDLLDVVLPDDSPILAWWGRDDEADEVILYTAEVDSVIR